MGPDVDSRQDTTGVAGVATAGVAAAGVDDC